MLREQKADASKYRFGYQGNYSEFDSETLWNHFELREYDAVIGRWLVPDPYREYWSPYTGMGNDPINLNDPNGGCTTCGALAQTAQNMQDPSFGIYLHEVEITPSAWDAVEDQLYSIWTWTPSGDAEGVGFYSSGGDHEAVKSREGHMTHSIVDPGGMGIHFAKGGNPRLIGKLSPIPRKGGWSVVRFVAESAVDAAEAGKIAEGVPGGTKNGIKDITNALMTEQVHGNLPASGDSAISTMDTMHPRYRDKTLRTTTYPHSVDTTTINRDIRGY